MTAAESHRLEERVLMLAPTARDWALTQSILARAGMTCVGCADQLALGEQLQAGAGAVLIAEEAVSGGDNTNSRSGVLTEWLTQQPAWSDLPVLLLARAGADSPAVAQAVAALGNVTIVERPMRVAALVSTVQSALRARQRQYQLRDEFVQRERVVEQLNLAMAAADAGSWEINLTTGEFSASDRAMQLHGVLPGTNLTHKLAMACVHPADRASVQVELQLALDTGKPFRHEHRVFQPDGSLRWILSLAGRQGTGAQARLVGMSQDVTERKQAEQARDEVERDRRALAEASSEVAYRMSADWSTLLPLDGRQVVGSNAQPLGDWSWLYQNVPPDEHVRIRLAISQALAHKSMFELEHRVTRPDFSIGWVFSRAVPIFDMDKEVIGWFGAVSDITARKQAEERSQQSTTMLRTICEASPDLIYVKDRDHRLQFANPATLHVIGLPEKDVIGKTDVEWALLARGVAQASAKAEAEILMANDRRIMATELSETIEEVFTSAAGKHVHQSVKTPMRDSGGAVIGIIGVSRDITNAKRAAEELRQSEIRFRAGIEAVSDIVWTNDANGMMAGEQVMWSKFTGQNLETYQGYGWSQAIHPDDAQPTINAWKEALAEKKNFAFEHRVRRHDGQWRLCTVRAVPVFDDVGNITEWIGVHSDITDRRQADRLLVERTALLDGVLESTGDVVFVKDLDGRCLMANTACAAALGLTPEQVVGKTVEELCPPALAASIRQHDYAVIESGLPEQREETFIVAGKPRQFLTLISPLREYGQIVGVVGVSRDITDRVKAEAKLRSSQEQRRLALDAAELGTWHVDVATKRIKTDDRFRAIFGTTQEHTDYLHLLSIIHPDDLPAVEQAVAAATRLENPDPYAIEYRVLRPDGLMRWVFAKGATSHEEKDGVKRFTFDGTVQDITARRQIEQERERLVNQLRDADRHKDEFLATLAHELRNPLAPLRNGLQLLKQAGSDHSVEQARAMMDRQLTQLVRLVDDLMDVSRVTNCKLELRTARVDLKSVMNAAAETSRPAIDKGGHTLTVVVPDEPIFVDGDAARLAQVVSNLLNNSAKYTHQKGHIWLTAQRDGSMAMLSVKDNGIGIPQMMLERVFDMFTQVDRTLEKTTGGLGIGLSLVKGLVQLHGGTIEAKSDGEGLGSEFVIRLPEATSVAHDAHHLTFSSSKAEPSARRRILVVDDNVDAADSLGYLLEVYGHEVRVANDGEAGVAAAEKFQPDMVLMDIGMPMLNGYEAASRIRQEPWGQAMVLVALTGWGQADDRRKSASAGFDHHLVKPVEMDELEQLMRARWQ